MGKRIFSGLTVIALLTSLVLPHAQAATDEQWVKSAPPTSAPSWGIAMVEDTGDQSPHSYMLSVKAEEYVTERGKVLGVKACKNYTDADCPHNEFQSYAAALSACENTADDNCVLDVSAVKADGTKLAVEFVRNFPAENKFEFVGDSSVGLPNGDTTYLVRIPGAPHAGGDNYLISVVLNGNKRPQEKIFKTSTFHAQIFAVSIEKGSYGIASPETDYTTYRSIYSKSRSGGCQIQCSANENAAPYALPLDVTFGLTVRLGAKVNGWLNGRVSNVESAISVDSAGRQIVQISGKAVKVPVIFGWLEKATTPEKLKAFYNAMPADELNSGNGFGTCIDPNKPVETLSGCSPIYWSSVLRGPGKDAKSLEEVALWLPILKDKAVAAPTMWMISSIGQQFDNNCSATSDRVSGIVTTNSTGYVAGPPVFNKSEQTLDYKVLAPHYLPDGTEFKGTYDLTIDTDFARCLYGFTKAPIGATVSVVSADGQSQVATVVVSQKDKWIHLGAYGFGFSSPTLKVKFTQAAAPVVAKKTTITCVKGKTVKKVTAVGPKCPSGFKKKS
jgi:hypothetical protein